jgi:hypothetical protein
LMELCAGFPSVRDVLAKEAPKGKAGRKKGGPAIKEVPTSLDRNGKTGTVPVLSARLAQEHPRTSGGGNQGAGAPADRGAEPGTGEGEARDQEGRQERRDV